MTDVAPQQHGLLAAGQARTSRTQDRASQHSQRTRSGQDGRHEDERSMADIAVQSSLSPLDALYKETRAQRKAARASSSTAPAATSVHETAQSAARTKGLLARIDSLKSRTNHVDARPPPPPTRQSSLKYNYDHQNASTRSSRDSDAMPRASILTVESANGDPFHYEAYASRPTSLTSHAEIEGVDPYLSRIPSNVTPRDSADIQQLSPRSPLSASSASPKSMSDERFQDIDTPPGPSPALSQRSFASLDPSSAAGRAPSQIAIRNYSRPSSSITTTTRSTRSVSNASSISTSGPPSSIGHSSSSHAASLSSSWDHRRQFELEKEELLAAECRASTSRLSGPSSRPEPASISTPVAIASSQRSSSPRGEPSVTFEEPASSPRKRSWSKRTSRPAAPAETDRLSASTVRASDYAAEPRRPHFAQSPSTLVKSSSNNNYRDSTLSFRDSPAAASMHRAQQSLRKAHFGDDSTQSSHSLFNLAQPSTPQEYLRAFLDVVSL